MCRRKKINCIKKRGGWKQKAHHINFNFMDGLPHFKRAPEKDAQILLFPLCMWETEMGFFPFLLRTRTWTESWAPRNSGLNNFTFFNLETYRSRYNSFVGLGARKGHWWQCRFGVFLWEIEWFSTAILRRKFRRYCICCFFGIHIF